MSEGKKVLVIDDEPENNQIISTLLTKAGYQVECVTDGAIGIERTHSFKPDAILLDINMPGLDGWDVCQNLKSDPETKDIKIIILTATRDLKRAKDRGADRVMLKPYNYQELIDVIG